jgi:hypothetical protein
MIESLDRSAGRHAPALPWVLRVGGEFETVLRRPLMARHLKRAIEAAAPVQTANLDLSVGPAAPFGVICLELPPDYAWSGLAGRGLAWSGSRMDPEAAQDPMDWRLQTLLDAGVQPLGIVGAGHVSASRMMTERRQVWVRLWPEDKGPVSAREQQVATMIVAGLAGLDPLHANWRRSGRAAGIRVADELRRFKPLQTEAARPWILGRVQAMAALESANFFRESGGWSIGRFDIETPLVEIRARLGAALESFGLPHVDRPHANDPGAIDLERAFRHDVSLATAMFMAGGDEARARGLLRLGLAALPRGISRRHWMTAAIHEAYLAPGLLPRLRSSARSYRALAERVLSARSQAHARGDLAFVVERSELDVSLVLRGARPSS